MHRGNLILENATQLRLIRAKGTFIVILPWGGCAFSRFFIHVVLNRHWIFLRYFE
jgi:hypothetical protein